MAPLPDIDTTDVSYLSYWNALNHGVNDIDPSDVVSDSNVSSYTIYDNGVIVAYTLPSGYEVTVRVKEDGWFTAYLDDGAEYGGPGTTQLHGPWDLFPGVQNPENIGDGSTTTLSEAIQSLQSQLSNVGSITFSHSDVGLYNYTQTSATTVTELAWNTGRVQGSVERGWSFTPDTTIYQQDHYAAFNGDDRANNSLTINGVEFHNLGAASNSYSAVDLTTEFDLESGTEHNITDSSNNFVVARSGHLHALWG